MTTRGGDPVVEAALHGDQPTDRDGTRLLVTTGAPSAASVGASAAATSKPARAEPREQPEGQCPPEQDGEREADAEQPQYRPRSPEVGDTDARGIGEQDPDQRDLDQAA